MSEHASSPGRRTPGPAAPGRRKFKAVFDFCLALAAVLALAPMLLALAVAVKAGSRGPVFHRSPRVGPDGRPFLMLKFRSMYVDPDAHIDVLLGVRRVRGLPAGPRRDPRITPVGRVIRELRLDELPQFFHVLTGRMGIVGPRPQLRRGPEPSRHPVRDGVVRPGITGLGPRLEHGANPPTREEIRDFDLAYLRDWTPLGDLRLLVAAVIRPTAAPARLPRAPQRIRHDRPRRAA
ncbi:sugar transferase [Nocardia sp. NPDC057668]|uniref:sugar transferase n=1 Tax=Nocardia sp. NPDC057668 TaxID=3346202 RepID=UPI00366AF7A2